MKLLAVDTSSKACSCAVTENGRLLGESYLNTGLTHSRTLTGMLHDTLARVGMAVRDMDALAVCTGPGSYTGLRIGVSTVKGMAMACNLPCVGVSTLLSLAQNVVCYDGIVCAALDARVGQVYTALFEIHDGRISRLTDDDAITLDELGRILPHGSLVVGDGTELVVSHFADRRLLAAPPALRYQRASSAAFIAEHTEPVPAALLVPNYHRKSQAEREREAREKESLSSK